MAANAASFPIQETSIAALYAAYLSGRATALSVCQAHLDRIVEEAGQIVANALRAQS